MERLWDYPLFHDVDLAQVWVRSFVLHYASLVGVRMANFQWSSIQLEVVRPHRVSLTPRPTVELMLTWCQMSHTLLGNETRYLIKQKQWKLLSQYFAKSLPLPVSLPNSVWDFWRLISPYRDVHHKPLTISWGKDWGENGFIRVSRDNSQSGCKIASFPYYPLVRFEERGEKDEDDLFEEINKGMECDVVKWCFQVMFERNVMLSSDVWTECDVVKWCLNGMWCCQVMF